MTPKVYDPSKISAKERAEFIAFVSSAGEVNPDTLPALVDGAVKLVMLHDGEKLIGTAAIKRPFDNHRRDEFGKASAGDDADIYPFELGWIAVHPDYREDGKGRALVAAALEAVPDAALYSTTKSDTMRRMLPEYAFAPIGGDYPSTLDPSTSLTLFVRPPSHPG